VRGIGNFIRRKYDDLDETVIADVVGAKLQTLRRACSDALGQPTRGN
jgi:hypothetical protein